MIRPSKPTQRTWIHRCHDALASIWICLTGVLVPTLPAISKEVYLSLEGLREEYRRPEDKYVEIGGITVHYRDEGTGPAVLLIHGSSSTLRSYDGVAAKLQKNYRVIRYDVPPRGLSGPVPDGALKKLRATDIPQQLLKKLEISTVTVVGVSFGGTIALFLAADYPDLVERVIVSNAPSDPIDLSVVDFGPSLTKAQEQYGAYVDSSTVKSSEYWRIYFNFYAGKPERISAETVDQTYDFARRAPEKNSTSLVSQVADQDKAIEMWEKVQAPTLLLWGGSDALLPPSAAENLAERLTSSQVSKVILPDVGHYPPIEVPERFAEFVDLYIRGVSADGLGATSPPHLR
jgi:pimeloyl-ACP methyl ester carboxylesterase